MSSNEKGAFHINTNKSASVSFIDNDGNTYRGTVKLNNRNNPLQPYQFIKGEMLYANGNVYDGEWDQNNNNVNWKSGKGTMLYANGDVYDGEWRYDRRFKGRIVYKNNENYLEYNGKWETDVPNGYGTLTYKNGKQITGFFNYKNDKFIIIVDNSNATLQILPDKLMAEPLEEDGYIPETTVVYEEPVGLGLQDNFISNAEDDSIIVPNNNEIAEATVKTKAKAKGMFASLKRKIGPVFGFSSAGYTGQENKFKYKEKNKKITINQQRKENNKIKINILKYHGWRKVIESIGK